MEAQKYLPDLSDFWARLCKGDQVFEFPDFPGHLREYFRSFSTQDWIDNQAQFSLNIGSKN